MRGPILSLVIVALIITGSVSQSQNNKENKCEYRHAEKTYYCKNIIDTFPDIFYGNYHLRCIECNIKIFSQTTMPYSNSLTAFNVSNSGIRYILPKAFTNLGNSQYFFLQNNEIVNISADAFSGLTQVYEVHLENNYINSLTVGFLRGLEANSVSLKHNKIGELPGKVFDGALNIMTLELQHNKIKTLHPDTFYGLDSLEFLELQNNYLCSIPLGTFQHLRTLRHLNLANNRLSTFAIGTFSGLVNLHTLGLANNSISTFDGITLLPMNHLSELDLSGNGIYYLDAHGIHSNAPTLRSIRIVDNIFSCSLLANIIRYLKQANVNVWNTYGRYNVQNVNGIACIERIVVEPISFKYFLQEAEREAERQQKYCPIAN